MKFVLSFRVSEGLKRKFCVFNFIIILGFKLLINLSIWSLRVWSRVLWMVGFWNKGRILMKLILGMGKFWNDLRVFWRVIFVWVSLEVLVEVEVDCFFEVLLVLILVEVGI